MTPRPREGEPLPRVAKEPPWEPKSLAQGPGCYDWVWGGVRASPHMPQFWLTPCQRKSSFPETEEKVRRLKRKNAELAVIAKRLEERARKLQETNLRVVRMGGHWMEAGRPGQRGARAVGLGHRGFLVPRDAGTQRLRCRKGQCQPGYGAEGFWNHRRERRAGQGGVPGREGRILDCQCWR